jgi:amino acid transporter
LPLIFAILIGYIYVGIEGNIYTGGQITQHPQGWLPFKDVNPTPLFNELNLGFGMISTFPAILFALNGFQFVPSLQHEMKKPNKLSFAMNVGLIIVLVIYIALSMSMMLCSDGSIRGLSQWMEQHKLK